MIGAILLEYSWLPFTVQEHIDANRQFMLPVKAVWGGAYQPKAILAGYIRSLVLVRNQSHPLFRSHDYGLIRLVDQKVLSVIIPPVKLGLLNEMTTIDFIVSIMKMY